MEQFRVICGMFVFNGDPLYYERRGSGKHFLLLIPEALGTGELHFSKQHEGFDLHSFTLISVDPIGYGKSRPAKRPEKKHYWVDAKAYHKLMTVGLGLKEYSILGFSDGGRVGLIMGAEYPNEVRKIIGCACSSYVTDNEKRSGNDIRIVRNWNVAAKAQLESVYGTEVQALWDEFLDRYSAYTDIFKDDFHKIRCPVFILHGELDPMVSVEHAHYFRAHLPNVKVYIHKNGSHYFHSRAHEQFNSMVTIFLLK